MGIDVEGRLNVLPAKNLNARFSDVATEQNTGDNIIGTVISSVINQ